MQNGEDMVEQVFHAHAQAVQVALRQYRIEYNLAKVLPIPRSSSQLTGAC